MTFNDGPNRNKVTSLLRIGDYHLMAALNFTLVRPIPQLQLLEKLGHIGEMVVIRSVIYTLKSGGNQVAAFLWGDLCRKV